MKVLFRPMGKEIEIEKGENLLKAATASGIMIDGSCAGNGKCGKCKVKVLGGDIAPLTESELAILTPFEQEKGYRLACQITVDSDMEILLPGFHGGSTRKKSMSKLPEGFEPDGMLKLVSNKVVKASMKHQVADQKRLSDALGVEKVDIPVCLLTKVHKNLEETKGNVSYVVRGNELIDIMPKVETERLYGVAFDIGTTTVVGMLWDLNTTTVIDVEAKTNYQSNFGADVISRIQYCIEDASHLKKMQERVVDCMNDILEDIYVRNHVQPTEVYDATVVGNTTMSHLVFGVTPLSMSRTPFAPVFSAEQNMKAKELGLSINPQANVCLLPNIAGHVGSDIVAMMLSAGIDKIQGCHVAIDIGTNGEVVAIKDGKMLCCSTAAGPAFEGATIRHGMRAATGAIERVNITDGVLTIKTIDDGAPIGICGSGLIDAVAAVLEAGIVEKNGRMIRKEEAIERGMPATLVEQLVTVDDAPAVLLATTEDGLPIVLSQQDIREVQLAKGAIYGGILTLMKYLNIDTAELDSVMLAGAFGNYIDKASALRIGLLPQVGVDKIVSIGNAAGTGSCMALLSQAERARASAIAVVTDHVELSANMDFQAYFADTMRFDNDIKFVTTE